MLLPVLIALSVSRLITRPLRSLTEAATTVRDALPALVEQAHGPGHGPDVELPDIPVDSDDEVGRLARAFNAVNATTLEVAREQAALRGSIAAMFVNVARRDQVLLSRQLAFIDQLERTEENPQTLENLFRLDHLATRMRRNAESLLVLAGIDTGRRLRRPLPLSDVVRTASSEIEHYERVDLAMQVDPPLVGHNALAAAHLLAELLENATTFSDPGSRVVVSTASGPRGVVVTIADDGLGMSREELDDANARIADPPVSEVVGAQRLGFYVVGRLARRLEVAVELQAGAVRGTVVRLELPPALFVPGTVVELPSRRRRRGAHPPDRHVHRSGPRGIGPRDGPRGTGPRGTGPRGTGPRGTGPRGTRSVGGTAAADARGGRDRAAAPRSATTARRCRARRRPQPPNGRRARGSGRHPAGGTARRAGGRAARGPVLLLPRSLHRRTGRRRSRDAGAAARAVAGSRPRSRAGTRRPAVVRGGPRARGGTGGRACGGGARTPPRVGRDPRHPAGRRRRPVLTTLRPQATRRRSRRGRRDPDRRAGGRADPGPAVRGGRGARVVPAGVEPARGLSAHRRGRARSDPDPWQRRFAAGHRAAGTHGPGSGAPVQPVGDVLRQRSALAVGGPQRAQPAVDLRAAVRGCERTGVAGATDPGGHPGRQAGGAEAGGEPPHPRRGRRPLDALRLPGRRAAGPHRGPGHRDRRRAGGRLVTATRPDPGTTTRPPTPAPRTIDHGPARPEDLT